MSAPEQKRVPLCNNNRSGQCKFGPTCKFTHKDCNKGMTCTNPKCFFGHPAGWIVPAQESTPAPIPSSAPAPRPQSKGPRDGKKKFVGKIVNELAMKHLAVVEGKQNALCVALMSSQNEAEKQKQFDHVKKALNWLITDFGPVFALYQKLMTTQDTIEANNSKLLSSSASVMSSSSSRDDEEDVDKMLNAIVLGDSEVSNDQSFQPQP